MKWLGLAAVMTCMNKKNSGNQPEFIHQSKNEQS